MIRITAYQHLYTAILKYHSSQLPAILQYLQYQASQLLTQSSLLFQRRQKAREYKLLTSMLNSKLDHRKEYFLFCLLFLHWNPRKLHPTSPFLSEKVKLLLWNKLTYGRFFHSFITRATWNHVPWKLYCKQLVEQLATQQLNLWASS